VISELRVGQLAPVAALEKQELYYVRVRSDVSLGRRELLVRAR